MRVSSIGVNAIGDVGNTSPGNIWSAGDMYMYILGNVCHVSEHGAVF